MTSIERLIANTERVISALKSFVIDPSGVVNVSWINANDTETTYSFDNIKKIQGNISGTIQSELSSTKYIDAVNGDDLLGDGSELNPYKTIKKAIDETPAYGGAQIWLKGNQTHLIDEDITMSNKTIVIDSEDKTVTAYTTTLKQQGGQIKYTTGESYLTIRRVRLDTDHDGTTDRPMVYTFFGNLSVSMQYCEVLINNQDFMFGYDGLSHLNLSLLSSNIDRPVSDKGLVRALNTTLKLAVGGVFSVTGNATDISPLIKAKPNFTNVLTNLTLI